MGRTRYAGFTLIEVMVILAVMVLLLSILLPVFVQAREKGRQARCLSNLRQIAAAMRLYAEDHDGALPPALGREQDEPLAFPQTWAARLSPYLRGTSVFVDLSSGRTDPDGLASNVLLASYAYPPSRRVAGMAGQTTMAPTFGVALWEGLGGYYGPPLGHYRYEVPSCSEAQVARPAETILICDHLVFDWGVSRGKLYFPAIRHLRQPDLRLADGTIVPQGILNAAFVDGHAMALKHAQLWAIRPGYTQLPGGRADVFAHFWPYE